jgi:signal transduction histidine kinase
VGAPTNRLAVVTGRTDRERLALLVHEVRSPVAAIAAIAEALSGDKVDDDALRSLVALAVSACRGVELLVGDAATGSIRLQEIDVGPLVLDAVAAASLGSARVRADVESQLPRIQADPLRLRQALDNLIANAVTHSSSTDEIVVGARATRDEVLLSVRDTGEGIPSEQQARIFEPGVRLEQTRPGSGLGLAVVLAIAEAHGGTVGVESAPGEGATFTIALLLRQP